MESHSPYVFGFEVELVFEELKSGLHLGRIQVTKPTARVRRSVALPVLSYLLLLRPSGHKEPQMKTFSLVRRKERFIAQVHAHEADRLNFDRDENSKNSGALRNRYAFTRHS